jgi:uncharacterized protein
MPIYPYCIPNQYVSSIYDIDYETLKEQGIKSLFFDLDNTIIAYDEEVLPNKANQLLQKLAQSFNIVILSNSGYQRVSSALKECNLSFIHHAKKPFKNGFLKALHMTSSKPFEAAMIGDQLMTDTLGANRLQITTILVKSVKRRSDHFFTKINRKIEKKMLRKIRKHQPKAYQERLKNYVEDH